MTETTRTCRTCKLTLQFSEFYRGRNDCRGCFKARVAKRYREKVEEIRIYQAKYREAHREKARATTARYRKEKPDAVRAAQQSWRSRHRESERERTRQWRIANPERRAMQSARRNALKRSGVALPVSVEQLTQKLAYWGYRCWLCGDEDPDSWDHVKPLSKGGGHMLANLRPAHLSCNSKKNARWPYKLEAK